MDDTIKTALETIDLNKQALVFVSSRASAEKTAEDIAKLTSLQLPQLADECLKGSTTKQCKRLAKCVKKGVAFHHAGLKSYQRDTIEQAFKDNKIKIICATPTLAAGINLPAYRVIIKSLKRYSGKWGMDWIPVLEYQQMAGRAGRPQFEKEGQALSIAKSHEEKEEIYERYVKGQPEDIYSKLAAEPVLRTYLLSLIATRLIRDDQSMDNFFAQTFWAHQFGDMQKLKAIMHKMVRLLEEWHFIEIKGASKELFTTANNLTTKSYLPTLLGKRIAELYIDPLTARKLLDDLEKASKDTPIFSLLFMVCHTLEMRPYLRVKKAEEAAIQDNLFGRVDELLEEEPSAFTHEYYTFLSAYKTALFFEAWVNEKDEEFLFEAFNIRPGEIRMKIEAADWLLYTCEELIKVTGHKTIYNSLNTLRVRIKHGVKEDLLPLLRLKNIGRVRARKLVRNSIRSIADLKQTPFATLKQIIGDAIAKSVKEQVGQEVKEEISPRKRKGQMSLSKF